MRKMLIALSTIVALLTLGSTASQAAFAGTVPKASPACGAQCFELSSLDLGTNAIQNAYIAGDRGVGGRVGQPVNLKHASNTRPNEDFTGAKVGTLADFCGNLISSTSYVCIRYPSSYPVFESDWSPFGNQTHLCVGIARPNVNREQVTLQTCGVSGRTLWVGDLADSVTHNGHLYTPWVNGSDPNFSHPLVLTVDTGSFLPENLLRVQRLDLLAAHTVKDTQQFTLQFGPVA
ncbi:MAG TPA: hypothetical protein VF834_00850 [Streptosporangiaceae bacterium]